MCDSIYGCRDTNTSILNSSLDLIALLLEYYGATLSTEIDESVSHVIVDKKDLSRLPDIQSQCREIYKRTQKAKHIVCKEWVSRLAVFLMCRLKNQFNSRRTWMKENSTST